MRIKMMIIIIRGHTEGDFFLLMQMMKCYRYVKSMHLITLPLMLLKTVIIY